VVGGNMLGGTWRPPPPPPPSAFGGLRDAVRGGGTALCRCAEGGGAEAAGM